MSDPSAPPIPWSSLNDGEQAMRICNACRYCEGFCAVFPAMERRLTFSDEDLSYLANLCHDCRECYYSCQYAPPHEFALNLPKVLGEIRRESYRRYAWPGFLVDALGRSGVAMVLSLFLSPALFVLGTFLFQDASTVLGAHSVAQGSFYRVISHETMVVSFGSIGMFVVVAMAMGLRNFWRHAGKGAGSLIDIRALARALRDGASLRYLDSDGTGCAYPEDRASGSRRVYHHLTFYGFLLCFAATSLAALYHNVFGWRAPYALTSLPVLLGIVGGVGLLVGPTGLLYLKRLSDEAPSDALQRGMDISLLVLLFLTSATGLLLLVLRETSAMGIVLAIHLGMVMGLFLSMPYGKFVHGFYRLGALVRYAKESRES